MLSRAYSWLTGILRAFVEHHQDVAAEGQLRVHGGFRREGVQVAVQVRLEDHALLGDFAQAAQAEHLEAARIGEDGVGPRHEAVQPAQLADQLVARPQITDDRCWPAGCATPRSSARSRWVSPLTVACVPTGMKTGVSMVPCARVQQAGARARVRALGDYFKGNWAQVRLWHGCSQKFQKAGQACAFMSDGECSEACQRPGYDASAP